MALQAAVLRCLHYPCGSGIRFPFTQSLARSHLSLRNGVTSNEDLWKHGNFVISTVNDILSLRKEVAGGNVASVIPLEYAQRGNLQEAVDATTESLLHSIEAFERAAKRVVAMGESGASRQLLSEFVLGLKFCITGNLSWSLVTERYRILRDDLKEDVRVELW